MKMYNAQTLLSKRLEDPAFKKRWDESRPYYDMVKALIDARNRGEMTQGELAQRLKTKQSAISRFESGRVKNPTISSLLAIAKALGVKITFLVEPLAVNKAGSRW